MQGGDLLVTVETRMVALSEVKFGPSGAPPLEDELVPPSDSDSPGARRRSRSEL